MRDVSRVFQAAATRAAPRAPSPFLIRTATVKEWTPAVRRSSSLLPENASSTRQSRASHEHVRSRIRQSMNQSPLRLCYSGASPDTGNLGVSALYYAVVGGLAKCDPRIDLTVFDEGSGLRRQHRDDLRGRNDKDRRCIFAVEPNRSSGTKTRPVDLKRDASSGGTQ